MFVGYSILMALLSYGFWGAGLYIPSATFGVLALIATGVWLLELVIDGANDIAG